MVKTGEWIGEAWNKVIKGGNLGKFMLLTLAYGAIAGAIFIGLFIIEHPGFRSFADLRVMAEMPVYKRLPSELLGVLVGGLIYTPLSAAVYAIILHFLRTGEMAFERWRDISPKISQIILAGLVIGLFSTVATSIWAILGGAVSILYIFALPVLLSGNGSFWQAMEESRKMVMKSPLDFLLFFWFAIVLGFVSVLGAVALGIGILVSLPISWAALLIAYRELWGESSAPEEIAEPGEVSE